MVEFVTIAVAALVVIALMTKTGILAIFKTIVFAFGIVRALAIAGLVTGVCCSPQAYRAFGFTPLSLMVGKHIYEPKLVKHKVDTHHEKVKSRP